MEQYQELAKSLEEKYIQCLTEYIRVYAEHQKSGNLYPLTDELNFMLSNLKYIEQYIQIIKNKNDIEKKVEKINCIKELEDILFKPKQNLPNVSSSKVEFVYT